MPLYDVAITLPALVNNNTGEKIRKERLVWQSSNAIVAETGESAKIMVLKEALEQADEKDKALHEDWIVTTRRWDGRVKSGKSYGRRAVDEEDED